MRALKALCAIWLVLGVMPSFASESISLPKNVENCLITFMKYDSGYPSNDKYIPYGTGFVYRDSSLKLDFIITNRHILAGRDSIFVRFNHSNGDSIIGKLLTLRLKVDDKKTWAAHPDATIDLAVVSTIGTKLTLYAINSEESKDINNVKLGDQVMFLGFPLSEAARGDINYPLVRSGIVSFKTVSNILDGKDTVLVYKDHIIIDGTVMPGNSGSPVLSSPRSGSRSMSLIGIISSHLFDLGTKENTHLGICIPADRIQETINEYIRAMSEPLKSK